VALVDCSAPKNSNYSYVSGTGLAKKGRSSLTYHDFAFQSRGGGSDTLLSQGEEKILLLPIQFSDFPFNATTLQDINTTFNGAAEDTHYWQSVSSFYDASSFGASKLTFTVAPLYESGYTMSTFLKHSPAHSLRSADILRDALTYYKTQNNTTASEFDLDKNGHIDGVFLVYSAPDYQSFSSKAYPAIWSGSQRKRAKERTAKISGLIPPMTTPGADVASPLANAYSWASASFMYKGVKSRGGG
jgi:hypothetical protein